MMQQTCQRCGKKLVLEVRRDLGEIDREIAVVVWIDDWSRQWCMCEGCAGILQRAIHEFAHGGWPQYPPNTPKLLPMCPTCAKPLQVCECNYD